MRILGIDPSSTCTGVGIVEGPAEQPVLVAGELLRPPAALPYHERVDQMVQDLAEILAEFKPDRAVIEIPDGKRHGHRGERNMASLAIYGFAAGDMRRFLITSGVPTRSIRVNAATRRLPKRDRQARVRLWFPRYDPGKDRGRDLSDALFLAVQEMRR